MHRLGTARMPMLACLCGAGLQFALATPLRATIPSPVMNSSWALVQSPHFVVIGNVGRADAVEIARRLERLSETLALIDTTMLTSSPDPTWVYALDGEATFKHYALRDVESLSGYCITGEDRTRLVINARADDESGPQTLYHEYTHGYLHTNFPRLPLWVDEGLAQYYSTFVPGDRSAEIGHPVREAAAWCLNHALFGIDELFAVTGDSPQYRRGDARQTFYSESWALVSYLTQMSTAGARPFQSYMAKLRRGEDPARSFAQVYPREQWPQLMQGLKKFLEKGEYPYWRYTFTLPFDPAAANVQSMERADVLASLGDLLLNLTDGDRPRAAEHFRAALEQQPEHAGAAARLGYINDLDGKTAVAESLYDRAYAIDPRNPLSCLLGGRGALKRFASHASNPAEQGESTPAELIMARQRFACCLGLEPSNTEALIGFAKTYCFDRSKPPTAAIRAMEAASAARPNRTDLLWDLLDLLKRAGRDAEADSLARAIETRVPEGGLREWKRGQQEDRAYDLLQQASRATRAEDLDEALRLFGQARDAASDARTRAEAERGVRWTRRAMQLHEARRKLVEHKPIEARDMLQQFLSDTSDASTAGAELRDDARGLLDHAQMMAQTDEGLGHMRAGRLKSARASFRRALELAKTDEERAYLEARIRELDAALTGKH